MQTTYLKRYRAPDYWIAEARFTFTLDPARTVVRARLDVRRSIHAPRGAALVLNGEQLELLAVSIDGAPLAAERYAVDDHSLTIADAPEAFILEIETACAPEANTALSGLYMSKGMLCTQCEAEGFRRITYFLDRPDVLAKYAVRIEADSARYPVLLANGNLVASGALEGGRHYAEWEDPHPKPAYLFALVAGDLAAVEDRFVTRSGRDVALKIFVQHENKDKCGYTLDALKRAMRWDEDTFGREYDLDIFMIVAVDHFNFGAMENKGLNIFNSAYVLASPETATDADYENIESIVAHEYFHNWSGNRVTLRDWFQLCLKEGFTVYRDQEFSADMRSRPVQRIKDVRRLWASQFPEDAGPLAHPPRPDHYVPIDNFYTATVYEKGAELARMMRNILGPEKFRAACDLYFDRHDGEAATVEDFIKAMEDAGGVDLAQFRRWYSDAGAPTLTAEAATLEDRLSLTLEQTTEPTPGQPDKPPRHMPVAYAVIGATSERVLDEGVLEVRAARETHDLGRYGEPVAVSLLRGFSAPVHLRLETTLDERLLMLRRETDLFRRWAEADRLWKDICLGFAGDRAAALNDPDTALTQFIAALGENLKTAISHADDGDPAFVAELLRPPSDSELAQEARLIDPPRLVAARTKARETAGRALRERLADAYATLQDDGPYEPTAAAAGRRALKNACLALLVAAGEPERAETAARTARNMTDEAAAAASLAAVDHPARENALNRFYERWRDNPLVVNKWLGWRAMRSGPEALADIGALTRHEAYDVKTPNKVRALLGVFAHHNLGAFHTPGGAGYAVFVDQLLVIDKLNPQLSARLSSALESWRRLAPSFAADAEAALRRLEDADGLSANLLEMVERLLSERDSLSTPAGE